jgi:hypothetical protein
MAAGSTYTPIATTTLGSAAASHTFSSISGSYTDLVLVIDGSVGSNCGIQMRFNSDSATNYSFTRMTGDGTTASSDRSTSIAHIELAFYVSTARNINIVQIMNYSNSTTYKTVLNRANAQTVNVGTQAYAELWRSTAAITTISVAASGNLSAGTTLTLYGIAAA